MPYTNSPPVDFMRGTNTRADHRALRLPKKDDKPRPQHLALGLGLGLALSGCYHGPDSPNAEDSTDGQQTEGSTMPGVSCADSMIFADVTPLRLLTTDQYNNTVADLFDLETPQMLVAVFAGGDLYDNNSAGLNATVAAVEHYESIAPAIAQAALANGSVTFSCDQEDPSCLDKHITDLGTRVFRRPVLPTERTRLRSLYDNLRGLEASTSPAVAFEGVLAAMLQMPSFLYHLELGAKLGADSDTETEIVDLTGYEMASRLSYFLWNSTPPPELLAAAADDELSNPSGIAQWTRWLLQKDESARSRAGLALFHEQWLGIEQGTIEALLPDEDRYPEFDDALAASMRRETLSFIGSIVFDRNGSISDLFTAQTTFVDSRLAPIYGVEGDFGGSMTEVTLDPDQRAGLLTHASLLATRSNTERGNPIARGVFIANDILCAQLGAPPAGVEPLTEEVVEGGTLRAELEAHSKNPCATCHVLIDPLGLSFEHYDAIGRFHETDEAGNPIDASGILPIDGDELALDGAPDLAAVLASSSNVHSCVTRHYLEYAIGRSMIRPEDRCLAETLASDEGQSIRDTIVRITTSEMFRTRQRPVPEGI